MNRRFAIFFVSPVYSAELTSDPTVPAVPNGPPIPTLITVSSGASSPDGIKISIAFSDMSRDEGAPRLSAPALRCC